MYRESRSLSVVYYIILSIAQAVASNCSMIGEGWMEYNIFGRNVYRLIEYHHMWRYR
jgi:hypothetical protein